MRRTIFIYFVLASGICVLLYSCEPEPIIVQGMAPIYISPDNFSLIKREDPREFENLGNIVIVDKYMFINEEYRGIHVLDNSNPSNPIKLHFWNIPGNLDFTIVGQTLYADNSVHLLVIDVHDYNMINVVSHIKNLYVDKPIFNPRPPNYRGPFECATKSKGISVQWEEKELTNPLCEAK